VIHMGVRVQSGESTQQHAANLPSGVRSAVAHGYV